MQLTIKDHNEFNTLTILSIDLSKEIQQEIMSLEHEHGLGYINDKQFKLKMLSVILRSEAG